MPSWGRSFGARNGKRRGLQDERSLQLEDDMRFELVDGNEDEGHSIGLDTAFSDDDLDLMEGVFSTQQQARSTYYDRYASYLSESTNSDLNNSSGGIRQLAYRDKEDQLVQIAMDRIRRAQALGERNVRLTRPELDALDRKRRKNHAIGRNAALPDRSSSPSSVTQRGIAAVEPRSSKRRINPNNPGYTYNGLTIQGNSTAQATPASSRHGSQEDMFPGHFRGSQVKSYDLSMQPRTQSVGSHSTLHQNMPSTTTRPRDHQKRYFSVPKGFGSSPVAENAPFSRRLPDDPQWIPRARSASSNQPYSTGDISQPAYTASPLNPNLSRPQARRSVFENYRTLSSNWERGIQPPMPGTTPPQQFEGSDAPMSILSHANTSGGGGFDDYSTDLDYVPRHEPKIPRAQSDGYSRR